MSYTIQFRRGTTVEHSAFTGEEGEVTYNTTAKTLVVHDGTTIGGVAVARLSDIPTDISDLTDTESTITTAFSANLTQTNHDMKTLYLANIRNLTMNPEGTKLYTIDNRNIREYDLSVPYDIASAVATGSAYYYYSQIGSREAHGITVAANGSSIYVSRTDYGIVYQFDFATAFNMTTLSNPSKSVTIESYDNDIYDIHMNTTGTTIYTTGGNTDEVHQFTLSSPFDISTAVYANKQLDISANVSRARSLFVSPDGDKLFVYGDQAQELFEYTVATPGDISTATYSGLSTYIRDADFVNVSPDGSKLYATEGQYMVQYNLSGAVDAVVVPTPSALGWAFDIDSVVFDNITFDWSTASPNYFRGAVMSPDGTYVYKLGNRYIYRYTLSVPYNMSTAVLDGNQMYYYSMMNWDEGDGIEISSNGEYIYVTSHDDDKIYQWKNTTAWDISAQDYASRKELYIGSHETNVFDIDISEDGKKMIMIGTSSDRVHEYVLTTPHDISTAYWTGARLYVGNRAASNYTVQYASDGSALYVFDQHSDSIHEYKLGTAFDVSSANTIDVKNTYIPNLLFGFITDNGESLYITTGTVGYQYKATTGAVATVVTATPSAMTWTFDKTSIVSDSRTQSGLADNMGMSPDGTQWYVVDSQRYLKHYTLSTPYDISTATYLSQFDAYSRMGSDYTYAFEVAADGSRFYLMDRDDDIIYSWLMPTPWLLSSINSYSFSTYNVRSLETNPQDLSMSHDGKKMVIVGSNSDTVYEYVLRTPFDISTSYWTGVEYNLGLQTSYPSSVQYDSTGTKLYVLGQNTGLLHEYSMTTAYDLSSLVYVDSISIPLSEFMYIAPNGSHMYRMSSL